MSTFNRNNVAEQLKFLRDDASQGQIDLNRGNWVVEIANELFITPEKFTIENFPPALLLRLNTLMDIPNTREPTGKEYARALQNFINRRADPWNFFRETTETTDQLAEILVNMDSADA